ncbi:undecaprenyldiphospho-muramoylpentapeptide beta-N-acetylglucosaminyltransferase [Hartmannibacter diazotrophicus]|uniref:Undecaprenyldiphospho-muramoylpentapeptide beta-N-acetylglucosaminyltransferase n=1 Tax=Hartmannibacter diazotrophicus TaxID=1482074 RepID=A0A2C9DAW4_9HYPH|nr:glycosyltransferase [Hartmannibacter diazotrophicus]SON57383.1 undecaprenyldiphospho-muramoylpentapeptide beta-N-acetylglucosaminyltransferase [Hartmannibacter diazotrophicus]
MSTEDTRAGARGGAPRVLFYVQHLLGIGHLARASRIAGALVDDGFDVTMVTGGAPVPGFPGPGVRHLALPAILAGDSGFSGITDENRNPVDDAFKARRRDLLLAAYRDIRPDAVVIEAFPFGRRQVRFELLPLLEAIAAEPKRPLVLTSLRDILQERAKPGRDEESVDLVERHFDRVLVHGDPAFVRLDDTFPLAGRIAERVVYTGLVAPPLPELPEERYDVVVSAGGGAVGASLVRAARDAAVALDPALRWCLIAGPNLPEAEFAALVADTPDNVVAVRFRKDFPSLVRGARLSVSQAGYNTVCDLLRADCPALLVPFAAGGETEQTARAERLERLGLARVITEEALTAQTLAEAVGAMLSAPTRQPIGLDLDGARRTAAILRDLLQDEGDRQGLVPGH